AEFTDLLEWLGEELSEEVKQVRLSHRLTESAACMVGDEFDMTPQLEAMYRASGMEMPTSKRILELNPSHPLVGRLREQHAQDPSDPALGNTARLLSGAAVLAEGGSLSDPAELARLLGDRVGRGTSDDRPAGRGARVSPAVARPGGGAPRRTARGSRSRPSCGCRRAWSGRSGPRPRAATRTHRRR